MAGLQVVSLMEIKNSIRALPDNALRRVRDETTDTDNTRTGVNLAIRIFLISVS